MQYANLFLSSNPPRKGSHFLITTHCTKLKPGETPIPGMSDS